MRRGTSRVRGRAGSAPSATAPLTPVSSFSARRRRRVLLAFSSTRRRVGSRARRRIVYAGLDENEAYLHTQHARFLLLLVPLLLDLTAVIALTYILSVLYSLRHY